MNLIEPLHLQRLVDGELDLEETRRLLQLAVREPASWREIATTFVENRIWQSEFVDRSETDPENPARHTGDLKLKSTSSIPVPRGWWMSLAASVALALSVGFLIGQRDFDSSKEFALADSDQIADSASTNAAPFGLNQADQQSNGLDLNPAVYHMQLQDQKGNQYLDSEIPLYAAKQNDDLRLLQDSKIPDSIREQASDSGYQVQQGIRYVSGQLNDGRQFVIPIRNYRFSPNQ